VTPTTAAQGFIQASVGGPNFGAPNYVQDAPAPATGTVFALTQTVEKITGDTIGPDTTVMSKGATATVVDASTETVELKIPGLGIDTNLTIDAFGVDTKLPNGQWIRSDFAAYGGPNHAGHARYVSEGSWRLKDSSDARTIELGEWIVGYQTPLASMPKSGTAVFGESDPTASGTVFYGSDGTSQELLSSGDVSMTVQFATGDIDGKFAVVGAHSPDRQFASFSAKISGDTFAGTTAAPAITGLKLGSSTGTIKGGFYGPAADEAGAVWTLFDGTNSVVGTLWAGNGGPAPPPPPPYPISAPAPGTAGSIAPTTPAAGYQEASVGGPQFNFNNGPFGSTFALTQTAMTIGTSAMTPDSATNAAGATIKWGWQLELKIPSLGIDTMLSATRLVNGGDPGLSRADPTVLLFDQFYDATFTLNYAQLGIWEVFKSPTNGAQGPSNIGAAVYGLQTPPAAMPTSGTATYQVTEGVTGVAVLSRDSSLGLGQYALVAVDGDASLTADFASGAVTGSFTNMRVGTTGQQAPPVWNNVSISATISGATFAGTTATTTTPGGSFALGHATGTIRGGFYGPKADEIGAVWTLYDGTNSALGSVAAPKAAPSDRRLKRDIVPWEATRAGLELYRFRYLGDNRVFIGVMAQDLLADPRFCRAVLVGEGGFYWVDYGALGLDPPDLDAMIEAGRHAIASLH
jgi:hypothetical protein